jgi:hypothetical protein
MHNISGYTEVAEEGKLIGFYFQLYSQEWIAFSTIFDRPVMLSTWARAVTAEARIIRFYRDTLEQGRILT